MGKLSSWSCVGVVAGEWKFTWAARTYVGDRCKISLLKRWQFGRYCRIGQTWHVAIGCGGGPQLQLLAVLIAVRRVTCLISASIASLITADRYQHRHTPRHTTTTYRRVNAVTTQLRPDEMSNMTNRLSFPGRPTASQPASQAASEPSSSTLSWRCRLTSGGRLLQLDVTQLD